MCVDEQHISEYLHGIVNKRGEGVILRKVGSLYENGRNRSLYKVKTSLGDHEGVVMAKGKDGSVKLKLPNGKILLVASYNVLVNTQVGKVVSFSYDSYNPQKLPVHPKIYRVRGDISWEDVISRFHDGQIHREEILPIDYQAARLWFETFAKSRGLDPLLPETWYSTSHTTVAQSQDGLSILKQFKKQGGYFYALQSIFPDIGLNVNYHRLHYWQTIRRRQFFEEYAKKIGIDPLIPENWYKVTRNDVLKHKGGKSILSHHENKLSKALLNLFPNIGLTKQKFYESRYESSSNRKRFFEMFAKEKEFDPLIPENWYKVTRDDVEKQKGGQSVLFRHDNKLSEALLDLFPNIGLSKHKFNSYDGSRNEKSSDRRHFFEMFAKENGFNPLIPENWYNVTRDDFVKYKGGYSVLYRHENKLSEALLDLFPDIGLIKHKFSSSGSLYESSSDRRRFFEILAKEKGFDPLIPDNWYKVTRNDVLKQKGGRSVLYRHENKLSEALLNLFPNIGLMKHKFKATLSSSVGTMYKTIDERRVFFEKFAKEKGFDPLIPENWYKVTLGDFLKQKGGKSILRHYENKLSTALLNLFPDIGLIKHKLSSNGLYESSSERRTFFEIFAKEKGFDPLIPENWYNVTREEVEKQKGGRSVLTRHENKLSEALLNLFPDIGLIKYKLSSSVGSLYESISNRRTFFEMFAKEKGFDPLNPENWYPVSLGSLLKQQGIRSVLRHHKNKLSVALLDLFPDIGLIKDRFMDKGSE